MSLSAAEIDRFVSEGFLRIDEAFPRHLADEARAILWRDTGCDPDNPRTWTKPVVRLGHCSDPPFVEAANTPRLQAAYDALVGAGAWAAPNSLGTFPVRFPSRKAPGDDGWHVESAFPGPHSAPHDYMSWRINVASKGRALLMLFLFSHIGEFDAPTRIRIGSHQDVARILAPAGEDGLSFTDLAKRLGPTDAHPETLATGPAGTVFLCHPFLVHAAQPHFGTVPRFMAQPPLMPLRPFQPFERADGAYSPVEQAIRLGVQA